MTSLLSDGFSLGVRVALLAIFVGISVFPLILVTLGFHYGNKYTKLGVAVDKTLKNEWKRGPSYGCDLGDCEYSLPFIPWIV